jgi:hypothetical protein
LIANPPAVQPISPHSASAIQDVLLVMSNGQIAVKRIPFGKN